MGKCIYQRFELFFVTPTEPWKISREANQHFLANIRRFILIRASKETKQCQNDGVEFFEDVGKRVFVLTFPVGIKELLWFGILNELWERLSKKPPIECIQRIAPHPHLY